MNLPDLPYDGDIELPDFPDIPNPGDNPRVLFSILDENIPLLMLPVRLETRFYHKPERLRIRIYPDEIHVNSHQTALSNTEVALGHQFWERAWKPGLAGAQGLFRRLSDKLGVWRAAWLLDTTAPINLDEIGSGQPKFPKFTAERDPTAPSRIVLLPHYWTAVGLLDGDIVFEESGSRIPDTLRFAPFQMKDGADIERWMVDFDLAMSVGMALEIRLDGSKANVADTGLDELYVLGVRLGRPETLAHQLEDTLRGHYYTRGFDFVPQGTATNNTENVRSPWQWNTADTSDVYQRIIEPQPAVADSNRSRFASALGLDADGIVARASHGDMTETPTMEAMNLALWYITWGEYLRFVLHDGENAPLSDAEIDWLRDWFVEHIRGGAVYPAFHIGSMPYGVLPVQLQPVPTDTHTRTEYLQWVLWQLRDGWEKSLPNVPHLDPTATASATDPAETDLTWANENLISILSSQPHPSRFFVRDLDNLREGWSAIFFDPVKLYELAVSIMIDDVQAHNPIWASQIEDELGEPFSSLDDQYDYFQDLLPEINQLEAAGARDAVESILMLLDAHARRVAPINDLQLPPLMDVLSEITPNPEHFYFNFANDVTDWGNLPLVQPDEAVDGATPAVYLAWLSDYARGDAEVTGPEGLPDPAPLLFQLIKKAVDRANAWDGGSMIDIYDTFDHVDDIIQSNLPAQRMNAMQHLLGDTQKLEGMTDLLDTALKGSPDDATRQALANIPRSYFSNTSRQFKEYRSVSQKTSASLDRLIDVLDEWVAIPGDGPSTGIPPFTSTYPGGRAREISDALLNLVDLPAHELEQRLTETLGLAMHRLDAWITAYAEERVDTLRSKYPSGIQIGGYGWVENLRPDPVDESPTQGYIHAPSMTQAAMAAVLRSGHSAFSDGEATSPLSVDLRSDRVRAASWMMDGVRQGQRINDLLGYRFERYLHDYNLDVWIQPMRDVVAKEGTTELAGSTQLVTVDGLALLELWDEGNGSLDTQVEPPLSPNGKSHSFDEVVPALNHLVWITDSMADLALAESVHAVLQGDYERASAVQNAAALGDVPPPELRSIRTPNSGTTVTHRLMLVPQGSTSDWTHYGASIRSQMEPGLEAWAATILGDPKRIMYQVSGGIDDPVEVHSLQDLPLSALDAIYLAPAGGLIAGSALHALIAYEYRLRNAMAKNLIPDITVDTELPVTDDQITLHDFCLLAYSLRRVLGHARPATTDDFLPGIDESHEEAQIIDARQLMQRAFNLLERFETAITALGNPQLGVRKRLLDIAGFNLPQAIPAFADDEALTAQAESVRAIAVERYKQARKAIGQLSKDDGETTAEKQINAARQVFSIILGRDFPIMSYFQLPVDVNVIRAEAEVTSDPGNSMPAMGWLLKMARVRPELTALREVITAAEALQDQPLFPFWIAQLPHHAEEPWVGIGRPADDGSDRLSVVLTGNASPLDITGEVGGLVLDQWIERIPSDYEMTGLTFHYDAPTSRPPQVLLLALPPEGKQWDFDNALDTVREAFALARLRAVAPETLGDYGQQLPAVYLTSPLDTIGETNGI